MFCDIFPNILSSSKHVELILDSLGEPVFVKDGSLRFVYVNKAFCDFV
jgi:PAS domain-containing protein